MTWLKKDDRFPDHRKIRRLTDGAYRLHDTALCACAKDETDGLVTDADIDDMEHGPRLRKHIPALVAAGLWEQVPGGWEIHDYLHYNPSHEQLNAKRAADRERQNRRRHRVEPSNPDESPSDGDVSRRDSAVTPLGVAAVSQHPVPSRPVPSRPTPTGVSDGARKRATRLPADFIPSTKSREAILTESPALDLHREHAKFVDHWTAQPGAKGVKADWDATWRNWMRRAAEQAPNGKSRRQQETDDLFARNAARMGVTPDHLALEGRPA